MPVFRSLLRWCLPLIVLSALQGCVSIGGPRFQEERRLSTAHAPQRDLEVQTSNGSVEIRRSPGDLVRVNAKLQGDDLGRMAEAAVVLERDAGRLSIRVEWPGGPTGREGCDLTILVPDAAFVSVRTSNDEILLERVGQAADLQTSNDEIVVIEMPGELVARTSNDNIVVRGAGGPVSAATSNDDVVIVLTPENPGPVSVATSNDDVELVVGPGFGGTLGAATSNGRVRVRGMGGGYGGGGRSADLTFDRPGSRSTITTSNGDVEIEIRG